MSVDIGFAPELVESLHVSRSLTLIEKLIFNDWKIDRFIGPFPSSLYALCSPRSWPCFCGAITRTTPPAKNVCRLAQNFSHYFHQHVHSSRKTLYHLT